MTPSGWFFICSVWGIVIGVTAWCYLKLLGGEPKNPDPGGVHRL